VDVSTLQRLTAMIFSEIISVLQCFFDRRKTAPALILRTS